MIRILSFSLRAVFFTSSNYFLYRLYNGGLKSVLTVSIPIRLQFLQLKGRIQLWKSAKTLRKEPIEKWIGV